MSSNQNNSNQEPNAVPANEQNELPANTPQPPLENDDTALPETSPLILQTEPPMEVHAHTHTPRKKWTHYLWEFLMLFLAVFCGFLAENQREHMIEHKREKRYMENLYQDLKKDSVSIQAELGFRKKAVLWCDSLIKELGLANSLSHPADIYSHAYFITSTRIFASSSTTISQLRNSGTMRLIRKDVIVDSINNYYIEVERYALREQVEREIVLEYRKAIAQLLDGAVLIEMTESASNSFTPTRPGNNVALLTTDAKIINPVKSFAAQVAQRNNVNMIYLNRLLQHNNYLISLIKKEYHLN